MLINELVKLYTLLDIYEYVAFNECQGMGDHFNRVCQIEG